MCAYSFILQNGCGIAMTGLREEVNLPAQGTISSQDVATTVHNLRQRTVWFALLAGLTSLALWPSLSMLIRLAFHVEQYSHTLLIPPVSLALLLLERRRIFSHV